ncbi:hypothetical protein B0H19DRAFT_1171083 [Mycena capillaripes]|nr:hypothetical protein B0H19DRAFT_1171083 [Mycena capillaripes]
MTPQQRAEVSRVRYFAHALWLERRHVRGWILEGLAVSKLTITIRHFDWWTWENGEPRRLQAPQPQGWGGWVEGFPHLQELELEFENLARKRKELEKWIQIALKWKFPLKDGTLIHDGQKPVESTWFGTSRLDPARSRATWGTNERSQPLDLELLVIKFKSVKESDTCVDFTLYDRRQDDIPCHSPLK